MRMEVSKSRVNARIISGDTKQCSTNDKLNVSQLSERILEKILLFFFDRYRTVMYYRHEPRCFSTRKQIPSVLSIAALFEYVRHFPFSTISKVYVYPKRTLDKNRRDEQSELSQKQCIRIKKRIVTIQEFGTES